MSNQSTAKGRRDFLKLAGTVAPAALASVAMAKPYAARAQPVDLSSNTIQDTDHTRAYLDSARF